MSRNWKIIYIVGTILLVALGAGFSFPNYANKAIDAFNQKSPLDAPKFFEKPFQLGLDLQGGIHMIYTADLKNIPESEREQALQGLRDVIERRVNVFGVTEPVVQVQGEKLIVELAGIRNTNEAIKMIGQTPFLQFMEQRSPEERQQILDKQKEVEGKSFEDAQKVPNWQLALQNPEFQETQLTGQYLTKAEVVFDQTSYKPQISLQFNDEGAKIFEQLTEENVGKPLAIYIDGQLISAPNVQEKITGGKAQITGAFGLEEAKTLARNLNAGALPVPIELVSQQTVGPSLGEISFRKSLLAGAIGLLAVIIFMILFYKLPGVVAGLALVVYMLIILVIIKATSITLTLAGIAGVILSIGMAVDANVLIFARMREELKSGKGLMEAIDEGFRRAWPSVRDGNLTALIAALILFGFGTSFVKGFALTLIIGILVSMFSAVSLTRMIMKILAATRLSKLKMIWK